MSQDVIIYNIPEHACPKMRLFIQFRSMRVPRCIIHNILEHACPMLLLFTPFRGMHVPRCHYL